MCQNLKNRITSLAVVFFLLLGVGQKALAFEYWPPEIQARVVSTLQTIQTGSRHRDIQGIEQLRNQPSLITARALMLRILQEVTTVEPSKVDVELIKEALEATLSMVTENEMNDLVYLYNELHPKLEGHPDYDFDIQPKLADPLPLIENNPPLTDVSPIQLSPTREAEVMVSPTLQDTEITGFETADELSEKINTGNEKEDIKNIRKLGDTPSDEVVEVLFTRMVAEVQSRPPGRVSLPLMRELFRSLKYTVDESHKGLFVGALQMVAGAVNVESTLFSKLKPGFQELAKIIFPGVQINWDVLKNSPNSAVVPAKQDGGQYSKVKVEKDNRTPEQRFADGLKRIKEMRELMQNTLVDQDHIIEALLDLEFRSLVFGQTHPNGVNVALMGLPGTGKDTATMVWVDAIHGEKDAWVEHMETIGPIKSDADIQTLTGSPSGYVDSDQIPALVDFLVRHSAGKYIFATKEGRHGEETYVARNPDWKPGMVIREYNGVEYYTPDEGVVFLNETHNWTKAGLDAIKTFLEKGRLQLKNPAEGTPELPGVSEIIVPIRRVDASNRLAPYLANKRPDGTQIGKPPGYEEIKERAEELHRDPEMRKSIILEESAARSEMGAGDDRSYGMSQETLNRYQDRFLLVTNPLSPEGLQRIIRYNLRATKLRFKNSQVGFDQLEFEVSDRLVEFLQEWQYQAIHGARPILGRVEAIVEQGLLDAIKEGKIKPNTPTRIELDVRQNDDGTYNLVYNLSDGSSFEELIEMTESAKHDTPKSTEEIKDLYTLSERLNNHVFGLERITEKVGERIAVQLQDRKRFVTPETAENPAIVFAFLGLSSTGKTELSKAIAREVYGDEDVMLTVPFGEIKTADQLKKYIFGSKIGSKVEKSKVMEMWDRTNGKFVLNLDELANAPFDVQEALYDLLREKVFSGFADGKPRVTENLIITITGNAGEEWYHEIPRKGIPVVEQQAALYEIHRQAMSDPSYQRGYLEKHFKKALLNRIGMPNIFFFPPLNYRAIRQLTQHRLLMAIENLKPTPSKTGWNVNFLEEEELRGIIKVLETEGFELFEQGSSLVRYVKNDFEVKLKALLSKNGIANGSEVTLYLKNISSQHWQEKELVPGEITIGVLVQGQEYELNLRRQVEPEAPAIREQDQIFTAFHEAGHQMVGHLLLGDVEVPNFVTIIPGVTKIGTRWLRYLGLASSKGEKRVELTQEVVIDRMAVLAAGYMAQALVSKGARTDAGKSNDMERATELAYQAILCYGLSSEFGTTSCPSSVDSWREWVNETFSDRKKARLEKEVDRWIKRAENRARDMILANFELFEQMAVQLAEKGTLGRKALVGLYEKHKKSMVRPGEITSRLKLSRFSWGRFMARYSHLLPKGGRDAQFIPGIDLPEKVANIEEILIKQKTELLSEVALPENVPIAKNGHELASLVERLPVEELPGRYQYGGNLSVCEKALTGSP